MSDSDRESMSSRGSQEGLTRDHAADTAAIAAAGADAGVGEDDAYQSMRGMDQSGAGFADTLERDGGADDSQAGLAPGAADASAVVRSAEPAAALQLLRMWHAACSRSRGLSFFFDVRVSLCCGQYPSAVQDQMDQQRCVRRLRRLAQLASSLSGCKYGESVFFYVSVF